MHIRFAKKMRGKKTFAHSKEKLFTLLCGIGVQRNRCSFQRFSYQTEIFRGRRKRRDQVICWVYGIPDRLLCLRYLPSECGTKVSMTRYRLSTYKKNHQNDQIISRYTQGQHGNAYSI